MTKSKCCGAKYHTSNSNEGTSFYVCDKCSNACDVENNLIDIVDDKPCKVVKGKYIEEVLKGKRFYIKDNVDGQEHCLSGDKSFYLIDATDDVKQALLKQREMIMECLPKRIETNEEALFKKLYYNLSIKQFLDNIKDKGL